MKNKGLFGFVVFITHNSVYITHNSKMVRPIAEKSVWILFPVFVSITQFSDFRVMSYGNWKHILGVFSFHNFVFNGIFVIKHTHRVLRSDLLLSPTHVIFFSFFIFIFFSFTLGLGHTSLLFSSSSFLFFFFFHVGFWVCLQRIFFFFFHVGFLGLVAFFW